MENKRTTTFTALGLSGAGKTCYIAAMHYVMVSGEKGWTFYPEGRSTEDKLSRMIRQLENEDDGYDRFYSGTAMETTEKYSFGLHYKNEHIMNFEWIDYAGALFQNKTSETYDKIMKSIEDSTVVYIFVDGADLVGDATVEKKIRRVRKNAVRDIQPCITDFINSHNYAPPIAFVITKWDLCCKDVTTDDLVKILKESFNSLFYDSKVETYILPVSLGEDISYNNYTGELDPESVQYPIFIGIHHELKRRLKSELVDEYSEEGRNYERMITSLSDALNDNNDRFIIVRGDSNGGHIVPFDIEDWRGY